MINSYWIRHFKKCEVRSVVMQHLSCHIIRAGGLNMNRNPAKSTLMGIMLGLWIAASTALIILIKEGANEILQNAASVVADLPTLLFIGQLGLPEEWQLQVILIYCAVVGAILGWLKGMRQVPFWVLFVLALAAVIVSHWLPELVLKEGLPAAFNHVSHDLLTGR
jgi:hypothetical protein